MLFWLNTPLLHFIPISLSLARSCFRPICFKSHLVWFIPRIWEQYYTYYEVIHSHLIQALTSDSIKSIHWICWATELDLLMSVVLRKGKLMTTPESMMPLAVNWKLIQQTQFYRGNKKIIHPIVFPQFPQTKQNHRESTEDMNL